MDVSEPRWGGVFDASRKEHIRAAQNQKAEFPSTSCSPRFGRTIGQLDRREAPPSLAQGDAMSGEAPQ